MNERYQLPKSNVVRKHKMKQPKQIIFVILINLISHAKLLSKYFLIWEGEAIEN